MTTRRPSSGSPRGAHPPASAPQARRPQGGAGTGGAARQAPRHDTQPPLPVDPAESERRSRERRALSALRPPTKKHGDEAVSTVLFEALEAAAAEEADSLTHGFHSYPARLHPAIAARVLDAWAEENAIVVDPFCGSGTTLVEARVRGLRGWGVDLNPVALRVAEVKCEVRTDVERSGFLARLAEVVAKSKDRVRGRVQARAPVSAEVAQRFEGHVLKELAGLWTEIMAVSEERDRRALLVVLSAIVVKVSKQRADTDERDATAVEGAGRRMGRFIPTEIFHKKGIELEERWGALARIASPGPAPRFSLDDARHLPSLLKPHVADLIVTSPPYGGTYDYATHHVLRAPWLGLDVRALRQGEIGARRHLQGEEGLRRWDEQLSEVLRAIAGSLSKDGLAVLVIGDGEIDRQRVPAASQLTRLAPAEKLAVVATASAPRNDWRSGLDRYEHLVAIARR